MEDTVTQAKPQLITKGDFMGAMEIFEAFSNANPDDPAGFHGWAEATFLRFRPMEIWMTKGMIGLTRAR